MQPLHPRPSRVPNCAGSLASAAPARAASSGGPRAARSGGSAGWSRLTTRAFRSGQRHDLGEECLSPEVRERSLVDRDESAGAFSDQHHLRRRRLSAAAARQPLQRAPLLSTQRRSALHSRRSRGAQCAALPPPSSVTAHDPPRGAPMPLGLMVPMIVIGGSSAASLASRSAASLVGTLSVPSSPSSVLRRARRLGNPPLPDGCDARDHGPAAPRPLVALASIVSVLSETPLAARPLPRTGRQGLPYLPLERSDHSALLKDHGGRHVHDHGHRRPVESRDGLAASPLPRQLTSSACFPRRPQRLRQSATATSSTVCCCATRWPTSSTTTVEVMMDPAATVRPAISPTASSPARHLLVVSKAGRSSASHTRLARGSTIPATDGQVHLGDGRSTCR